MLSRREMLQGFAACSGAALGASLLPERLMASSAISGVPKRIVFFLQNQGFDPATCIPDGMTRSGSLAHSKLPEPIEALEMMTKGHQLADMSANIGSLDIVFGEIDR